MIRPYQNWLDSINSHLDFYNGSPRRNRTDGEFDWVWLDSLLGYKHKLRQLAAPFLNIICRSSSQVPYTQQWLNVNSELLWNSRQLLADELSKYLFDCHLLLILTGYQRYYFPRTEFEDFLAVLGERDFLSDLPKDYLGLPLKIFRVRLNSQHDTPEIDLLTTKWQLELLNRHRQYFLKRGHLDMSPRPGETVFDCGACIGEMSLLFAALVGSAGAIHLFDPVPLHTRYCRYQAVLNPPLSQLLHINNFAVSDTSSKKTGAVQDTARISPGGCKVDAFETTSLDDYVSKQDVRRIDYIKMDIEGAEVAALKGASGIIARYKPRLAISAYHKPDDLWEIPELIRKINPEYKLYFGHHSPINWESVYYAA